MTKPSNFHSALSASIKTQFDSVEDIDAELKKVKTRFSFLSKKLKGFLSLLGLASAEMALAKYQQKVFAGDGDQSINLRGGRSKINPVVFRKMSAKDRKQLEQQFPTLVELQDEEELLERMLADLSTRFKTVPKSKLSLKNTKAILEDVQKQRNKIHDVLKTIAEGGMSPDMKALEKELALKLEHRFGNSFDSMTVDMQVAPVDGAIHYVIYFCFKNLVNDDNFTYPQEWIIITEIIEEGKASEFSIWAAERYMIPGSYPTKIRTSTPDRVWEKVKILLSTKDFIEAENPREIRAPIESFMHPSELISKVELNKAADALRFFMDPKKLAAATKALKSKYKDKAKAKLITEKTVMDRLALGGKTGTDKDSLVLHCRKVLRSYFPHNNDRVKVASRVGTPSYIELRFQPSTADQKDIKNLLESEYRTLQRVLGLTPHQMRGVINVLEGYKPPIRPGQDEDDA